MHKETESNPGPGVLELAGQLVHDVLELCP
jgi:hypothetical protein